mgnify:CR=1 FL=1
MNIKKEATKHSMPFLKKYGRKLMRKIKGGLDIDDTQDIADKVGYAGQKEDILSKGFALGLELTTPLTAVPAIYEQSKGEEGSFLHTALTKQPEIPAIGGFQVGHNPETDIGKRSGDFIASLPGRVINAYKKNRQEQG